MNVHPSGGDFNRTVLSREVDVNGDILPIRIGMLDVIHVEISDGQEHRSIKRKAVQAVMGGFDQYLRQHPDLKADSGDNRAAKWLYTTEAMRVWREYMPSAIALYPLQRPDEKFLPDGTPVDPLSRDIFRHSLDAIGIRTRAKIMQEIAVDHAKKSDNDDMRWASLACGAAVPVLDAMNELRALLPEKDVSLELIDMDDSALEFARILASRQGLQEGADFELKNRNLIKDLLLRDGLIDELGESSFDMLDMLGIFEYFDDRRAAMLLQKAYRLVKPGGVMVIGNMLLSHPHLEMNQRAVGWPSIKPRSLDTIAQIIDMSGIETASVRAYVPADGVYTTIVMEKPQTEGLHQGRIEVPRAIAATALR